MEDPVLDELSAVGVEAEVVPCDPDLSDTDAFCRTYGYSLSQSANAIVVVGKSDPPSHVVCLVLADSRLDVNRVVRKRLGVRKASFASAQQTEELTGMEIGGVVPFGTTTELPIWVDGRVLDCERIILGGGRRDRKLLVAPEQLRHHPRVEVIDGLAVPTRPTAGTD